MTIVRTHYRYKRPPRKRKPNPAALAMPRIVHAKKPKPGRVPKVSDDTTFKSQRSLAEPPTANDDRAELRPDARKQSALVTIRRRKHATLSHLLEDMTPEEHKRRGDAADALWREMKRRIAEKITERS